MAPLCFRGWLLSKNCVQLRACCSYVQSRGKSTAPVLPRLPVPPLDSTLQKYLRTVKPHLTSQEFKVTEGIIKEFSAPGGEGIKLQRLLEDRAKYMDNWLEEWWLRIAYLDNRDPVIVHSSPGLVFPEQSFQSLQEQLIYASKLIVGALDFKRILDEDKLEVAKKKQQPLDMSQYYKVFSTCRIPSTPGDDIRHYNQSNDPPKHIVVAHNNHFFKVPVYNKDGVILSQKQILSCLNWVVSMSPEPTFPVGILTAENRNVWAKAYENLVKDSVTAASIREIQRCIFLLCLDGNNPDLKADGQRTVSGLQMLHGGGSKGNSGNRWFDKTIQFIVGSKGEVGLTYEHSPAEGVAIAEMVDHIVQYIENGKETDVDGPPATKVVDRLIINVDEVASKSIQEAMSNVDKLVDDLQMTAFKFDKFGKEFPKSQKISPDSFVQTAIQFAFYRIHRVPGAHYESASLRKFIGGRTETIRSCSVESVEFSKAMLDSGANQVEKVEALRKAVQAHKDYSRMAMNAEGVDRHLLGLKMIAIKNGIDIPRLYMDPGFIKSSTMRISTSQVSSVADAFMCFGPLVSNGYGCCYNVSKDYINFGLSAMRSCPETDSQKFQEALQQSLLDMRDLLIKYQRAML